MSTASPNPQKKPAPAAVQPSAASPVTTKSDPIKAPAQARQSGLDGLLISVLIGLLVLGVVAYLFGVEPRFAAKKDLDQEQKISNQRNVIYILARLGAPKTELPLPGTVEAFQQASIYARTSGYVKRWNADIGQIVHEGDILAELDTPEIDQQLSQAKSTAEQAQASYNIAQTAADRWEAMVKAHAVSVEEADEKKARSNETKATLAADQAEVQRLTELQNFKIIRAPFTGTVTYRKIEVGNLVSAGTAQGTSELFRIAQTDPLRVYVSVPEANTRSIQPGVEALLHVPAYPDRIFHGEVIRSAGALDTNSRTLRTEIRVPNPDAALLPGAYAEVRLQLLDSMPTILIPANALIVNSAGTQVALIENIDGQDKVHFLPVKVGRDLGTEVEILQSVKEGDRLVTNPPADLGEGAVVTAKPLTPPQAPPQGLGNLIVPKA